MTETPPLRVLIFHKTSGYYHTCIPTAIETIAKLGERSNHYQSFISEKAEEDITSDVLRHVDVVVLLHNTGDFLASDQISALQEFLKRGGGIVAIHGAAAGMLQNDWYGEMIGAHFDSHPDPEEGTVAVEESNASHPILSNSSGTKERQGWKDEWYNFTSHPRQNERLKILLKGDPRTFKGGKMGEDHPLAWCQEFGGGRVFYTALGHFDEAYQDEWFMGMIEKGILWAGHDDDAVSLHQTGALQG